MILGLDTIAAAALSIGVFCLIRWLPFPIQEAVLTHSASTKSRTDYLFGVIGTVSYIGQIVRLLTVGINLPHHSSVAVVLVAGAIIAAAILFGVAVFNFLRTIVASTSGKLLR